MIHSYLFDPVQVPSPGFVNEVNSCKLEEDDTVRLKGTQSHKAVVPRNALPSDGLTRTESRRNAADQPCQGPLPQEDSEGKHCVEKHALTLNGISPMATLQPVGSPRPHLGDGDSWTSTVDSAHPAQPFFQGAASMQPGGTLPTLQGPQSMGHGDCRGPAQALADHVLQIPAPDYPQFWGPSVERAEPEEKDCLFENHPDEGHLPGTHPRVSQQGLDMSFSLKRSWDSLNKAMTTDILNVYFKEELPVHPTPVAEFRNEQEEPRAYDGNQDGFLVDEDAEVAEALAALEAATAGEDADEVD